MTGSLIEGFGLGGVFPAGQYSLVKTYHVTFVQKVATSAVYCGCSIVKKSSYSFFDRECLRQQER